MSDQRSRHARISSDRKAVVLLTTEAISGWKSRTLAWCKNQGDQPQVFVFNFFFTAEESQ